MTAPTMEQMLDYLGMCERAMHITGMEESCFVSRREELTRARNAVLARFAELERERYAYRADAGECEWEYTDEPEYAWDSACGEKWQFMDGGPAENSVRFCHGCGKPVKAIAQRAGETG